MKRYSSYEFKFFLSLVSVFAISSVYGEPANKCGLIGAPVDPGPKKDALSQLHEDIHSIVLGATPAESVHEGIDSDAATTTVQFNLDRAGIISNIKFVAISNSIARDFWTIWAIASCPPLTSTARALVNNDSQVCYVNNNPSSHVALQAHEDIRVGLEKRIQRKKNAQVIYFDLLPPSVAEAFPGLFSIDEICAKENFAGIEISTLTKKGLDYWCPGIANESIKKGKLCQLLKEWPTFFQKQTKPSKSEMLEFVHVLKKKYRSLLKGEEPVAPLP